MPALVRAGAGAGAEFALPEAPWAEHNLREMATMAADPSRAPIWHWIPCSCSRTEIRIRCYCSPTTTHRAQGEVPLQSRQGRTLPRRHFGHCGQLCRCPSQRVTAPLRHRSGPASRIADRNRCQDRQSTCCSFRCRPYTAPRGGSDRGRDPPEWGEEAVAERMEGMEREGMVEEGILDGGSPAEGAAGFEEGEGSSAGVSEGLVAGGSAAGDSLGAGWAGGVAVEGRDYDHD